MALTLAQLQDYINTNVKKNGRQAITGDVMNYLMLQFVDWVDTYSALPDKGGHALKFLRVNAAGTALEWAAVSSGITVGTTPVTSGTDGRVFFQSGGVVSQDDSFLWDNTNKTLTNHGKGGDFRNTSFGLQALMNRTTGQVLTAYGTNSMLNMTTGGNNAAFGWESLRNGTSNFESTAIGNYSLLNSTHHYNTALGHRSGYDLTSGVINTFIGHTSGTGITTGSYNTIIGVNIPSLPSGTSSNVILSDGLGNIALRKDSSHFVGIGYSATATLGAKLDILTQGASSTDIALRVRNSANTVDLVKQRGDARIEFRQRLHVTNQSNFYIDESHLMHAYGASSDVLFGTRSSTTNGESFRLLGSGSFSAGSSIRDPFSFEFGLGDSVYALNNYNTTGVVHLQLLASSTSASSVDFGNASGLLRSRIVGGNGSHLEFYTNPTNSGTTTDKVFELKSNGSQILGKQAALSPTATDGFTYIPSCEGTPTGVPTTITGKVPMVADTTNNKIYAYLGGVWTAMN